VCEQLRGEYNQDTLRAEARKGRISRRHSDYESPEIKVVETPGKGRGVVAVRALPAGTLLMASKAFVAASKGFLATAKETFRMETTLAFSAKEKNLDIHNCAHLVELVIHKLRFQPERSAELYSLSGGARFDGKPLPGYLEVAYYSCPVVLEFLL